MSQELFSKLKAARRKLDLTQAGAAKAWGVPLGTLVCWENRRRNPCSFTLAMLDRLLDEILEMDLPAPEYQAAARLSHGAEQGGCKARCWLPGRCQP